MQNEGPISNTCDDSEGRWHTDLCPGEVMLSDFLQQREGLGAAADQLIRLHFLHKERGLQQRQAHVREQPGQKGPALFPGCPDPTHEGLEDALLAVHVQVVPLQDGLQRVHRQLQEVLLLGHLGEVSGDVLLGVGLQGGQHVALGKIQDPDAAVQVKRLAQEAGASVDHS